MKDLGGGNACLLVNKTPAKMASAWRWKLAFFIYFIPTCLSSGVLEFHVISFSSNCEESFGDACDHSLTFCFDKATNSPNIDSCQYKRQTTGVYNNDNAITFDSNMKGVPNPIIVALSDFSDNRVLVVMRSIDVDEISSDDHVVTMSKVLTLYPSSSRSRASYKRETLSRDGNTFIYEYMAYCNKDLYGSRCTVRCVPQDNASGHYTCHPDTGAKICLDGWEGNNCADDIDECSKDPEICSSVSSVRPKICVNSRGSYSCVCPDGWTGTNCEIDIDECVESPTNPCQNGGTCNNTEGSYSCQCPENWTGPTCAEDVDECSGDLPSPCTLPNTECNNTLGGYSCVCVVGWTGDNCTEDVDECQENDALCQNGGTCQNSVGSFSCDCPSNWTGNTCSDDVNECSPDLPTRCLEKNTRCENTVGGYTCVCDYGWRGETCTEDADECQEFSGLCDNGGTCQNLDGSYECKCPSGWTGQNCTEDFDECANPDQSPCTLPNYKCQNEIGTFSCVCADGWRGDNCTEDVDECAERDLACENGGNCTNLLGSYRCDCPENWTGFNCSEDVDECASTSSSPCPSANYKCINGMGNFSCVCEDGWRGENCEVDVDECQEGIFTCVNNGTCENLPGSSRCLCQTGWRGVSCAVDIDECASMPCATGATCVNLQGSFQCECADGSSDCESTSVGELTETNKAGFMIWPIIVAIAVLLVIVILIAVFIVYRRRRRREKPILGRPPSHTEVNTFHNDDVIMFENGLYHSDSRHQLMASPTDTARIFLRAESNTSDQSTRPPLPPPPVCPGPGPRSEYDVVQEEPVYYDIDETKLKAKTGGEPWANRVQQERESHTYDEAHLPHLDLRPNAGEKNLDEEPEAAQKNKYEDFNALHQAAAALNTSKVDSEGYMEPAVLRSLSAGSHGEYVAVKQDENAGESSKDQVTDRGLLKPPENGREKKGKSGPYLSMEGTNEARHYIHPAPEFGRASGDNSQRHANGKPESVLDRQYSNTVEEFGPFGGQGARAAALGTSAAVLASSPSKKCTPPPESQYTGPLSPNYDSPRNYFFPGNASRHSDTKADDTESNVQKQQEGDFTQGGEEPTKPLSSPTYDIPRNVRFRDSPNIIGEDDKDDEELLRANHEDLPGENDTYGREEEGLEKDTTAGDQSYRSNQNGTDGTEEEEDYQGTEMPREDSHTLYLEPTNVKNHNYISDNSDVRNAQNYDHLNGDHTRYPTNRNNIDDFDDSGDEDADPLEFIERDNDRAPVGPVTFEPVGETVVDDDIDDVGKDDEENFPPPPPEEMFWQYRKNELARKPSGQKGFI